MEKKYKGFYIHFPLFRQKYKKFFITLIKGKFYDFLKPKIALTVKYENKKTSECHQTYKELLGLKLRE